MYRRICMRSLVCVVIGGAIGLMGCYLQDPKLITVGVVVAVASGVYVTLK